MRNAKPSVSGAEALNPVAAYARKQDPASGAICDKLQAEIDRMISNAASRIWHGSPVWFLGENPIVGYSVRQDGVTLMLWSGQLFDEPLLKAIGKDKAAQVGYQDVSEINTVELRRWLKKAKTTIFDYAGMYASQRAMASNSKTRRVG